MIKNKVTNISNVKLEFFVKVDNSEDKLVSIEPGEVVFSDNEEMTKSMRVFERKNLISIVNTEFDSVSVDTEKGTILAVWEKDLETSLEQFHNIPDFKEEVLKTIFNEFELVDTTIADSENPYKDLIDVETLFESETSELDEAKKQAEEYVEGEIAKEKKKYNYKKKPGRKKKRGPKPGSRRKKEE